MYMIPQDYECRTCDEQFKWSIHHDPIGFGEPFCPYCFRKFLMSNVTLGVQKDKK